MLSRGRPAVNGPMSLVALRARCSELNATTVKRASARQPRSDQELEVAREVWRKTMNDVELGRAGTPVELHDVDLREVLLVEVFGISEQHGNAAQPNVRGIHNFRANLVNECALMLQKL